VETRDEWMKRACARLASYKRDVSVRPMRNFVVGLAFLVANVGPVEATEAQQKTGEAVSGALAKRLTAVLQETMAKEGPLAAIGVCNLQALPLTAEVLKAHPEVRGLRRVGVRTRNTANAQDEMDRRALASLVASWKGAESANGIVMSDRTPEGLERTRYYRPLPTAPACLVCHGPSASMAPPVAEALRKLYPRDKATGFNAGELRGAIVVEF
jgi:hypothetical protein